MAAAMASTSMGASSNTTLDWVATTFESKIPAEVDAKSCSLLGPVGIGVQALMGLIVLASLLVKRARETPRRPWRIWILDVSKQVLGQGFVHASNVLISDTIAHHSKRESNPCSVYLLNILVDTTFGVALLFLFLRGISYVLIDKYNCEGFVSGYYGSPPKTTYWLKQLSIYILAILLMKLCVVTFLASAPVVYKAGHFLLGWLSGHADAQVIFTILIMPTLMNVLQFLIIDSFIKDKHASFQLLPDEENSRIDQASPPDYDDSVDDQKQFITQSDSGAALDAAQSTTVGLPITAAQPRSIQNNDSNPSPPQNTARIPTYGTSAA